jgi:hypothetical protein
MQRCSPHLSCSTLAQAGGPGRPAAHGSTRAPRCPAGGRSCQSLWPGIHTLSKWPAQVQRRHRPMQTQQLLRPMSCCCKLGRTLSRCWGGTSTTHAVLRCEGEVAPVNNCMLGCAAACCACRFSVLQGNSCCCVHGQSCPLKRQLRVAVHQHHQHSKSAESMPAACCRLVHPLAST